MKFLNLCFFAVPVVSSTFAAFGRCFRDFECEDIGYLLIDEAGQAALSNAVGALWRSRHAVVVGDPLQLEPVVTLPANLNKILLKSFGIDDSLNLATASVQGRADFHEKFGTYINGLWVGSPLRVHNRCDNPMFEIANEIAYEGLMIWGRNKNKGKNPNLKSVWVDVKSTNFVENFSEQEGRKALEIVKKILKAGKVDPNDKNDKIITQDDIKIISPFRGVVKAMKAIAPELKGNIGTIHTMQGKEAKVIIFVLGGASGGARAWAASKPNLLNVALTRAKNYIYIIGNRDNWKDLEYFKDAADKLEIRIINEI
ncbi:DNA2/NAM7 family helicase [Campylobacter sp. JMF_01 NE2]|uniref:DEAD/DEAH box helicase n=1 Tax=unclassified Campylobacter TaxID=2593542 RepID=UPI0022E9E74F|nr:MULTISPECIES: DEAD/DEAH box helicase [unclassified Campylobacter]MDA3052956.1 DNA2/NAM7 family helicase [Campylobacter sp. JMF_03 NE3]MDA3067287.1 DNA2/NAM7 family helicase [Campylobacter sp. JMF_01 NE2]